MTYPAAIRYLYGLRLHGLKLGLENTRRLAVMAGSPQERLRFIHVAGTNGKGSTCAMLESIYRAAGLKVGLFTSPHLVSFRERIQVNRAWISETEVTGRVAALAPCLSAFPTDHPPTFFEVVTVLALGFFADQGCDLVIWETGMGGRLDATNIVRPLASLITNIQFDHQRWLGGTHAAIAAEKAGIIKAGIPALTTTDQPEALEVIRRVAAELGAPLTVVSPVTELGGSLPADWTVPLPGMHQRTNAALALATVRQLESQLPVDLRTIRAGLAAVRWQGRMQLIHTRPDQDLLLDGAHNFAGMEALVKALQAEFPHRAITFVLGILQDKDWRAMMALAASVGRRMLTVPVHSERSASAKDLAETCRESHPGVEVFACGDLPQALEAARQDAFVVIAGSLYLVGEALEWLGLVPENTRTEHELNEWLPTQNP